MKIIGLTGSIGMGKSVAAGIFRRLGVAVHDSDAAVHALLAPNGKAFERVALTFPECWNAKTHQIDRQKLGQIVFSNPQKKEKLEAILHPLVGHSQIEFVRKAKRMGLKRLVLDIPLLFETRAERNFCSVACVTAPFLIQKTRVLQRSGMTLQKFYTILDLQLSDTEKRRRADQVIQTGLGYAHTLRSLKKYLRTLEKKNA